MKTQRAFSLLQIMIVLAIVGILATFAIPSYQDSVVKSRRADGQSALFYLATQMERSYFDNESYANLKLTARTANSAEGWYKIEIREQDDHHYLLAAIPKGAQSKDTQCETLTINDEGQLGIVEGPTGAPKQTPQSCWS